MQDPGYFMRAALDLSKRALPTCRPNPPVGCVVVEDGEIVSSGFTQEPGGFHAEAMALHDRRGSMERVTVYVTLEPCSFHGRTPSCARALVARGVPRVVVAMLDPHPKNRGAGVEILRRAGVGVEVGTLAEEVEEFLRPYLIRGG